MVKKYFGDKFKWGSKVKKVTNRAVSIIIHTTRIIYGDTKKSDLNLDLVYRVNSAVLLSCLVNFLEDFFSISNLFLLSLNLK